MQDFYTVPDIHYITLKFQQLTRQWYLSVFTTLISFETLSNSEKLGTCLPHANTPNIDQEEVTIS